MKVLVIESRYYPAVADALMDGATAALEKGGAVFERLSVPGVLELAPAIAIAAGASAPLTVMWRWVVCWVKAWWPIRYFREVCVV